MLPKRLELDSVNFVHNLKSIPQRKEKTLGLRFLDNKSQYGKMRLPLFFPLNYQLLDIPR